jgi:hypothetical protein
MVCSVHDVHWVDIDVLEQISPGSFVNQPLNIQVNTTAAGAGPYGKITVVARMQKN